LGLGGALGPGWPLAGRRWICRDAHDPAAGETQAGPASRYAVANAPAAGLHHLEVAERALEFIAQPLDKQCGIGAELLSLDADAP
jgi:hypothetical protein